MRRYAKTEKSLSLDEPGAMEQLKQGVDYFPDSAWMNRSGRVMLSGVQ